MPALVLTLIALVAVVLLVRGDSPNLLAFLALIRQAESGGDYGVIAGGARFTDFSEHPFIVNPNRPQPLGSTASGAYQMVRRTWIMARDALGLHDFSAASQDAAAAWLIAYKVPGENAVRAEGTGNLDLVNAGRFDDAIAALAPEWESFDKMARGTYPMTLDDARAFLTSHGGTYA